MPSRVLLVDDHQLLRDGLRALLDREPELEVVGEAENGRDAVRLAGQLKPDIVVLDVRMPDLNGIEAARQLRSDNPECRVVALSMHSEKRFVTGMLGAGASAYVLKACAFDEVVTAINTVLQGRMYTSPRITDIVLEDYVRQLGDAAPSPDVLTPREREVLQLLAEGRSTRQIGARLHVSVNTVDTHRRRIMEKLDIHSVAELTKYAIREGLTSLES